MYAPQWSSRTGPIMLSNATRDCAARRTRPAPPTSAATSSTFIRVTERSARYWRNASSRWWRAASAARAERADDDPERRPAEGAHDRPSRGERVGAQHGERAEHHPKGVLQAQPLRDEDGNGEGNRAADAVLQA